MDGIDRILDGSDINSETNTWIVLESPHANAADRIQLLMYGHSFDTYGYVRYNPEADYVGATVALPTSANDLIVVAPGGNMTGNAFRMHMLADTEAPYGFAFLTSDQLSPDALNWSMALCPFDTESHLTPGKPYALFVISGASSKGNGFRYTTMDDETIVSTSHKFVAQPYDSLTPAACSAVTHYTNGIRRIPNVCPQAADGRDMAFPVIFQTTVQFFGVSSFIQWTGTPRNRLETLEDDTFGTRGRIVFGDVTFPWDGVTPPVQ
jgi:hypothetical protein